MENGEVRLSDSKCSSTLIIGLLFTAIVLILSSCDREREGEYSELGEAVYLLRKLQFNQEKHFLAKKTYANQLTEIGFDADPFVSDSGAYIIDLEPSDDPYEFVGKAVILPGRYPFDNCASLSVDSLGKKVSEPNTKCWCHFGSC